MAQNSKWFENDIELPLTPSQKKLVEEWLPKFIEARRDHFGRPELDDETLKVGAPDLLDFLFFIGLSQEFEFDLLGVRKAFQGQLEELLSKNLPLDQRHHYQQVMNLLNSVKLGSGNVSFSADRFHEKLNELQ